MKNIFTKITLYIGFIAFLAGCSAVKRVDEGKLLLEDNTIKIDGKVTRDEDINSLLYQKPNTDLFGFPLQLQVYNLAKKEIDTTSRGYIKSIKRGQRRIARKLAKGKEIDSTKINRGGFQGWLKRTGEAPVVINSKIAESSLGRLENYQKNRGWFNAAGKFTIDTLKNKKKRGTLLFEIENGKPFFVDNLDAQIASPVVDSIYSLAQSGSFIKKDKQFNTSDFENERARLTNILRNSGVYHFQQNLIKFELDSLSQDTLGDKKNVSVSMIIPNRSVRDGDETRTEAFNIFKISKVNIYTDYSTDGAEQVFNVHRTVNGYDIFGKTDIKYRASALLNPIFIEPGKIYRDTDRSLTIKHLNELRTFRYPNIQYVEDPADSTDHALIANIYLSPLKKYGLGFNVDLSHSNIQDFGVAFGTTLSIRNIFRGTETLDVSLRGSLGSSKDVSNSNGNFFNVTEFGADVRLNIPRILFFLDTRKYILKTASPLTQIAIGGSMQQNIGLDRQNLTGLFGYRWNPREGVSHSLDVFNIQYVRNLNTGNYFNVYRTSYRDLNLLAQQFNQTPENVDEQGNLTIPEGSSNFIKEVLNGETALTPQDDAFDDVKNIEQRRVRLTDDNLILSGNFVKTINSRKSFADDNFFRFRGRLEVAGNLASSLSEVTGLRKNDQGNFEIFNVAYSQYIKTELDYVKYWDMKKQNVLAFRSFFGIALPYGNSQNIPFTKSFFGGGSNDNRAWTVYSLGPGKSENNNEFNEANMKIALSAEYRFPILGGFKGAFFADAGNIWNVYDDNTDPDAEFEGLQSLEDLALGTGFGLRYDFSFFVLRFDTGFKTYDPAEPNGSRWFRKYNFSNAVLNIGINYPF